MPLRVLLKFNSMYGFYHSFVCSAFLSAKENMKTCLLVALTIFGEIVTGNGLVEEKMPPPVVKSKRTVDPPAKPSIVEANNFCLYFSGFESCENYETCSISSIAGNTEPVACTIPEISKYVKQNEAYVEEIRDLLKSAANIPSGCLPPFKMFEHLWNLQKNLEWSKADSGPIISAEACTFEEAVRFLGDAAHAAAQVFVRTPRFAENIALSNLAPPTTEAINLIDQLWKFIGTVQDPLTVDLATIRKILLIQVILK